MNKYTGAGWAVALAASAVSLFLYVKMERLAAKVDMTVSGLANATNIEVDQAVLDRAIQVSVDREVEKAASKAMYSIVSRVETDLNHQVKTKVENAYSDLQKSVADRVSKYVLSHDMEQFKKDVVTKAKEDVAEKFNDNLEDILSKFNQNLENVSTIYGSIAGAMAKPPEKEMVFKIG